MIGLRPGSFRVYPAVVFESKRLAMLEDIWRRALGTPLARSITEHLAEERRLARLQDEKRRAAGFARLLHCATKGRKRARR